MHFSLLFRIVHVHEDLLKIQVIYILANDFIFLGEEEEESDEDEEEDGNEEEESENDNAVDETEK